MLRTARALFLRDGFQPTSIAKIADEAGFSTGAVYSNFSGKTELALLVLREIEQEQLGALERLMSGPESATQKLDRFRDWAEGALDSGWPRLELEFALEVGGDRALVTVQTSRQHDVVNRLATAFTEQLPGDAPAGVLPIRELADAAVTLAIGLAVRRVVDPKVSPDSVVELLRDLLSGVPGGAGLRSQGARVP